MMVVEHTVNCTFACNPSKFECFHIIYNTAIYKVAQGLQTICDCAREILKKSANFFLEIEADFTSPIFNLPMLQILYG